MPEEITGQDNRKDVYAHFGLAAYFAQCFEIKLHNLLLIHARLTDKSISLSELEALERTLEHSTLGKILRPVRERAVFDENGGNAIEEVLERRNYLMHRFFKEHATNLLSYDGRERTIQELVQMLRTFQIVDAVAEAISMAAAKVLGVTDELIAEEFEKLQRDANHQ